MKKGCFLTTDENPPFADFLKFKANRVVRIRNFKCLFE